MERGAGFGGDEEEEGEEKQLPCSSSSKERPFLFDLSALGRSSLFSLALGGRSSSASSLVADRRRQSESASVKVANASGAFRKSQGKRKASGLEQKKKIRARFSLSPNLLLSIFFFFTPFNSS
jgi:hypothetical protein